MCIKFESCKICVPGNQCENSVFDFHNAEHKELPVIKISSDEGREDCHELKGLRLLLFHVVTRYIYDAWRRDFALSASFVLRVF